MSLSETWNWLKISVLYLNVRQKCPTESYTYIILHISFFDQKVIKKLSRVVKNITLI